VMYYGYSLGEQWGQMGTEYIVGGVLLGRVILPHVKQRSWRSASSKDVGIGGFIMGIGSGGSGTVSDERYMHPTSLLHG
jgi:hypothetical protein